MTRLLGACAALALLGACDTNGGKDEERREALGEAEAQTDVPAAGKAEEGRFSIKGPGFDMKINIPEEIARNASGDGDTDMLYPGAAISGMHVEARPSQGSQPNSGVEIRFTSADAPDRVSAWYRDPARASAFAVSSVAREGDTTVISGSEKSDGDPFTVRLTPRSGGGTDGRLTLSDRG